MSDSEFEDLRQARPSQRHTSGRRTLQSAQLVQRVRDLATAGTCLRDIDLALHTEGFTNSKGTPWPKRSDRCVLRRLLKQMGISVPEADHDPSRSRASARAPKASKSRFPKPPQAERGGGSAAVPSSCFDDGEDFVSVKPIAPLLSRQPSAAAAAVTATTSRDGDIEAEGVLIVRTGDGSACGASASAAAAAAQIDPANPRGVATAADPDAGGTAKAADAAAISTNAAVGDLGIVIATGAIDGVVPAVCPLPLAPRDRPAADAFALISQFACAAQTAKRRRVAGPDRLSKAVAAVAAPSMSSATVRDAAGADVAAVLPDAAVAGAAEASGIDADDVDTRFWKQVGAVRTVDASSLERPRDRGLQSLRWPVADQDCRSARGSDDDDGDGIGACCEAAANLSAACQGSLHAEGNTVDLRDAAAAAAVDVDSACVPDRIDISARPASPQAGGATGTAQGGEAGVALAAVADATAAAAPSPLRIRCDCRVRVVCSSRRPAAVALTLVPSAGNVHALAWVTAAQGGGATTHAARSDRTHVTNHDIAIDTDGCAEAGAAAAASDSGGDGGGGPRLRVGVQAFDEVIGGADAAASTGEVLRCANSPSRVHGLEGAEASAAAATTRAPAEARDSHPAEMPAPHTSLSPAATAAAVPPPACAQTASLTAQTAQAGSAADAGTRPTAGRRCVRTSGRGPLMQLWAARSAGVDPASLSSAAGEDFQREEPRRQHRAEAPKPSRRARAEEADASSTRGKRGWRAANAERREERERLASSRLAITQDGRVCPICSQPWHRCGSHQVCTLGCGHLFGRCCIEDELRHRASMPRGTPQCPLCRAPAMLSHIRLLFATNEVQPAEAEKAQRDAELHAELAREEQLSGLAQRQRNEAERALATLREECRELSLRDDVHRKAHWLTL